MNTQKIKNSLIKIRVLTYYGGGRCACVECGFEDVRALSIDHINSDGAEHRNRIGGGGQRMYRWLSLNDYPEGYQTLCMNCQFIKRFREDIDNHCAKKYNTLGKKVRKWIEMRDTKDSFRYMDIRNGLALDIDQSRKLRYVMFRLNKNGTVERVSNGRYRKILQPIQVFKYINQLNEAKNEL